MIAPEYELSTARPVVIPAEAIGGISKVINLPTSASAKT